nr:VOC family protein [uncultured Sphingomonas sp.]
MHIWSINLTPHIALLVRDYDEALAFYPGKLDFTLVEDLPFLSRTSAGT